MTSFFRFILTVLIAGIVVNLTVILLANVQSQRRQLQDLAADKASFKDNILDMVNDRKRRLDIVVESQLIERGVPVQSTLLLRQYASTGPDISKPLPVHRIVIPGGRLSLEGVILEFDSLFAQDAEDFRVLRPDLGREMKLAYFGQIWGADEVVASPDSEDRFTLMPPLSVPELTRLYSDSQRPTPFESRLWLYIWDLIKDQPREIDERPMTRRLRELNVTWTRPFIQDLQGNHTYSAFINTTGVLSVQEENDADVRESIWNERKRIKAAEELNDALMR